MYIKFAQDFDNAITLDNELIGTPDSGLYWNRGVHPLINLSNILAYIPNVDISFSGWVVDANYGKFTDTQAITDIVSYDGKLYQSLSSDNIGNQPNLTSDWLETNIESLRIKAFIERCKQNMYTNLNLVRKLVENQYVYNIGEELHELSGDYSGWVIEPKGSDYVNIRINELSLQANTTGIVNLYVINQGQLIDTLQLTVNNGIAAFERIDYTISGIGRFYFVFESQEVKSNGAYNDPLKYNGFVMYPVNGVGTAPQDAIYTEGFNSNGLSFNITAYLDSSKYIDNNLIDFSKMLVAQFEHDLLKLFVSNANTRVNYIEGNVAGDNIARQMLNAETFDLSNATVAKKYYDILRETRKDIERTFDRFLKPNKKFTVKRRTIG